MLTLREIRARLAVPDEPGGERKRAWFIRLSDGLIVDTFAPEGYKGTRAYKPLTPEEVKAEIDARELAALKAHQAEVDSLVRAHEPKPKSAARA